MEVIKRSSRYDEDEYDVIEAGDAPPPLYDGTLLEEKPWRKSSSIRNFAKSPTKSEEQQEERNTYISSPTGRLNTTKEDFSSPNPKGSKTIFQLPGTPSSNNTKTNLVFMDDDEEDGDHDEDLFPTLSNMSSLLSEEGNDNNNDSSPDKRKMNNIAEKKKLYRSMSTSRIPSKHRLSPRGKLGGGGTSRLPTSPTKEVTTTIDNTSKEESNSNSSNKKVDYAKLLAERKIEIEDSIKKEKKKKKKKKKKDDDEADNDNSETVQKLEEKSEDVQNEKTGAAAAEEGEEQRTLYSKSTKRDKKKKRSKKDEKLFQEMAQRICTLGTQVLRQQRKKHKLERLLKASVQDVLYLGRRFEDIRLNNLKEEEEELEKKGIKKELFKEGEEDDNNDDDKTELQLNIELREIKAKLRMEQQEHQNTKDEVDKLRQHNAESQVKAEDLEEELNFHSAKSSELQMLLLSKDANKAVNAPQGQSNDTLTVEVVDLRSKLKVMTDEVHKFKKEIEGLQVEKESNNTMVSELTNIIDPNGLWDDDLKSMMSSVKDGGELEKDKALELTIKHLTARLEQSEEDKQQYVQKIVGMKEQLAKMQEQLEDKNSNSSPADSKSSKIMKNMRSTLRRASSTSATGMGVSPTNAAEMSNNSNHSLNNGTAANKFSNLRINTQPTSTENTATTTTSRRGTTEKTSAANSTGGGLLGRLRRTSSVRNAARKTYLDSPTSPTSPASDWCAPAYEEPSTFDVKAKSFHGTPTKSTLRKTILENEEMNAPMTFTDDLSKSNHV